MIGVVLAVSACAPGQVPGTPTVAATSPPEPTAPPAAATGPAQPPAEPVPVRSGDCPYLDSSFVADTNGQRVGSVRLSSDQPHPACFFYRADGGEQLRVQVLAGADPATARALVDRAAPVASSDPATLPGGWEGGKQPTETGAVCAVAKAGAAVVVVTNQKQTIKASRIAERVITTLGL